MRDFNRLMTVGALSALVAMSGLTGCSWQRNKEAKATGRSPSQVTTDKDISKRVASELKTAPIYKYPNVQVNTFNGTVQLSGFVHTDAQKQEATEIAKQTPGVNQVRNDLVVQPLTPTGRTGQEPQANQSPNKPYQAPVITPPQNQGAQEQPKQETQPQPSPGTQP